MPFVYDYNTLITAFQRVLVVGVAVLFALSFGRVFLTAVLTPFCGKFGAGVVTTVLFFGAVLLLGRYAVTAVQGQVAGVVSQITQPFSVLTNALNAIQQF
ncbi:MAG: hypothetical protein ACPLTR_08515 [Thermacetogeniaceae bacterium]